MSQSHFYHQVILDPTEENQPVIQGATEDAGVGNDELAKLIGDRVSQLVGEAMGGMEDGSKTQHFVDKAVSQIIADTPRGSPKVDDSNEDSIRNNYADEDEPYRNIYGEPSDRPKSAKLNNTEKIVLNCVKNIMPEADVSEFEEVEVTEFDHLVATNAIKKSIINEVLSQLDVPSLLEKCGGKKKQCEIQLRAIALDEKERWLIMKEKEVDDKWAKALPEDEVAKLRKEVEAKQEKVDAKIKELDPWAGALHRWE